MTIQDRHGFLCDSPFLRCVCLNDISLMDEKRDIETLLIIPHPVRLIEKSNSNPFPHFLEKLQSGVAVKLGVRQDRKGERWPILLILRFEEFFSIATDSWLN